MINPKQKAESLERVMKSGKQGSLHKGDLRSLQPRAGRTKEDVGNIKYRANLNSYKIVIVLVSAGLSGIIAGNEIKNFLISQPPLRPCECPSVHTSTAMQHCRRSSAAGEKGIRLSWE